MLLVGRGRSSRGRGVCLWMEHRAGRSMRMMWHVRVGMRVEMLEGAAPIHFTEVDTNSGSLAGHSQVIEVGARAMGAVVTEVAGAVGL